MSFSTILDQDVPVRLVRRIVAAGRVPNGMLFWGPGGVGKRLAALETAKAINCLETPGDACDRCLACRKIAHGNHPDLKIVAPAGATRVIKVEAIEEIIDLAMYRPYEAKWRVVIVHDADRINNASQNHFLKTLEEPPSATVFILITENPRMLLPTIRSRCQHFRFGALNPETVVKLLLRDRDLPRDTANAIAMLSQGQMSRALDLIATERREVVLDIVRRLNDREDPLLLGAEFHKFLQGKSEEIRRAVAADYAARRDDPAFEDAKTKDDLEEEIDATTAGRLRLEYMEYLYLLKTWYRDVYVYRVTGGFEHVLNADRAEQLAAERSENFRKRLEAVEKAWVYIERNIRMDRVLRDLFIELAA